MAQEPTPFSFQAGKLIAAFRRLPDDTSPRTKKRPTREVGNLVEEILQQFKIGRDSPEQTIRDNWSQVVGPANAQYSHAVQIDPRGRLTVHAGHAVVRNEIFMHRQTIVARIRALPGCSSVKDLNIRAG